MQNTLGPIIEEMEEMYEDLENVIKQEWAEMAVDGQETLLEANCI